MNLLCKQLKIDLLPACTIVVNVLISKKCRCILLLFRKIDKGVLLSQASQLIDRHAVRLKVADLQRRKRKI